MIIILNKITEEWQKNIYKIYTSMLIFARHHPITYEQFLDYGQGS